jgi:hypothetical protein
MAGSQPILIGAALDSAPVRFLLNLWPAAATIVSSLQKSSFP